MQITAPHFCAAVEIEGSIIVRAAPILRYAVGWTADRLERYAIGKGWKVERLMTPLQKAQSDFAAHLENLRAVPASAAGRVLADAGDL